MIDILWSFFELIVTVFEEFVIIHFICKFLGHNFSTLKGKVIYVSGSLVGSVVVSVVDHMVNYESWLGAVYMAYWFIFALLFLDGKILNKFFAVLLANMVVIFSSTLIPSSVSAILRSEMITLYSQKSFIRFMTILLVQLCIFYFCSLILKIIDKALLKLKKKEWGLIISVFVISFFSLIMIQLTLLNFKNNMNTDVYTISLLLSAEFGIVVLNSICLYMTIALSKGNKSAEELKLKTQQYEYSIQYAETIRKQYEEMRSTRHDIKQHFAVIQRLHQDSDFEEAIKYTNSCVESISKPEIFIDVGDVFINAILNSKLSIAKSKGIEVMCRAGNGISGINAYDLCNLLGNILDNAIEGTQKVSSGKFIEVVMEADEFKLNIRVSNSIDKSVLETNKKLKTSKGEHELHGLGIKTIRSLAEKYNGTADFYEEGLIFYCHVIMYK